MSWIEDYIRQAAAKRGIDPDIAIKVANSEGGVKDPVRQSDFAKGGTREPSYGPFQLLVGGQGTNYPAGLGNDFMRQTGLDPRKPENAQAGIDFALDHASKNGWGAWYGAKRAGIDKFAGIGGSDMPGTMATMASAAPKGPAAAPVINAGGGNYTAPQPQDAPPPGALALAGEKPERSIADVFSLLAAQQQSQPQIQPVQIQGPSPEQSQALLAMLKTLNTRRV